MGSKAKGIKKIQGSVICDGSEFGYEGTPKSWDWDDIGNYYGAAAQGVNFYDNTIKIYFKTKSVGQKSQVLEIFPKISNFSFKIKVGLKIFFLFFSTILIVSKVVLTKYLRNDILSSISTS